MTIEITHTAVAYTGNGNSDSFPVPFPVLEKSHIEVLACQGDGTNVSFLEGTDYSVLLVSGNREHLYEASIQLTSPLPQNWTLHIRRGVPCTQENVFNNQGPNSPKIMELGLDKLTMIGQQLTDVADRQEARLDAVGPVLDALADADSGLQEQITGMAASKADKSDLAASVSRLDTRDQELQTQIDAVADTKQEVGVLRIGLQNLADDSLRLNHLTAANPHPQYSMESSGVNLDELASRLEDLADTALDSSHIAADDPHPQYLLTSEVTPARERLSANRTYYIRKDGKDTNSGLSATDAFLTCARALQALGGIDGGGANVYIDIGAGTWEEGNQVGTINAILALTNSNTVGISRLYVRGAGMTATTLRGVNMNYDAVSTGAPGLEIRVFDLRVEDINIGLIARDSGRMAFYNIDFGAAGYSHVSARGRAQIEVTGNYKISGGSPRHFTVAYGSTATFVSRTVTLENTPAFSYAFVHCIDHSSLTVYSNTFTGEATGRRYVLNDNAIINTNGGGAGYLPGSSDGTANGRGTYYV